MNMKGGQENDLKRWTWLTPFIPTKEEELQRSVLLEINAEAFRPYFMQI